MWQGNRLQRAIEKFLPKFYQISTRIHFRCAPLGVGSLIASGIAKLENIEQTVRSLGIYILVVLIGLIIYNLMLVLPITSLLSKTHPGRILKNSADALFLGCATGSA